MISSGFIKLLGIAMAFSLVLVSCATMGWVGEKKDAQLKGLQPDATIGVIPFVVTYKDSAGLVKTGKEAPSQDRSPAWMPYNVKTVVASPDAIRDYAVSQSDISLLARDGIVAFITSTDPFDISVRKDFQVKRYASKDQESSKSVQPIGMVKALQAVGTLDPVTAVSLAKENGVQFILAGTVEIQGETAYVTPRQTGSSNATSYGGSPSQWKPGDTFAELHITYHIDLYSGTTGEKVDSSDNYKLEFKDVNDTPYFRIPGLTTNEFLGIPDVSALSLYMKSPAFKDIVQTGMTAALNDYTPILKSYFELTWQEVKPKQ